MVWDRLTNDSSDCRACELELFVGTWFSDNMVGGRVEDGFEERRGDEIDKGVWDLADKITGSDHIGWWNISPNDNFCWLFVLL